MKASKAIKVLEAFYYKADKMVVNDGEVYSANDFNDAIHFVENLISLKSKPSKPLKDQSYHQKRIADAAESMADNYIKSVGKIYHDNSLSEDDVRRIVKEEMKRVQHIPGTTTVGSEGITIKQREAKGYPSTKHY